ncbi:transcriptional regulator NrdR [Patescibacteria group bacterium]|nr:transcriptional regulator NrdR [Patescibacteria group bacterium]MBU1630029.1 transcriptional regulator NrdR [Patescibacteria group bacterium]MBU1907517.1 transcriptional regulator NrdR [Patescibacteria group bacterium]
MHCPVCNHEDTKVIDTRLAADGASVRRRRECVSCEYRFSTHEEVELLDLRVVKRDGNREAYSREKVAAGLKRALEKRSHTEAEFRALVNAIERDIQRLASNEITSMHIGDIVMDRLKSFDQVAYIRFASVYRSFEDVKSFKKEIEDLK